MQGAFGLVLRPGRTGELVAGQQALGTPRAVAGGNSAYLVHRPRQQMLLGHGLIHGLHFSMQFLDRSLATGTSSRDRWPKSSMKTHP